MINIYIFKVNVYIVLKNIEKTIVYDKIKDMLKKGKIINLVDVLSGEDLFFFYFN